MGPFAKPSTHVGDFPRPRPGVGQTVPLVIAPRNSAGANTRSPGARMPLDALVIKAINAAD